MDRDKWAVLASELDERPKNSVMLEYRVDVIMCLKVQEPSRTFLFQCSILS